MRVHRSSPIGRVLALLALVVQLAAGALVPAVQAAGPIPICHTGDDTSGPATPAPAHPPGCLLCPGCPTHAASVSLLTPGAITVPAPNAVVLGGTGRFILTTTAIPPPPRPAAYPRAPPSLA